MSGLGGLLHLSGRPAALLELDRLSVALAVRGPDGAGAWQEGACGLVHRCLRITPEAQTEQQPLASADGRRVIVADARLDNRAELCAALGLRDEGQPDAALILAAYDHWGEDCAPRLVGDFAFAVWDARDQVLYCARDYFGARPFFYYHAPGRLFAFASTLPALLALPEVPRQVSERHVAGFLIRQLDYENSFYADVHRLAPAHSLTLSEAGLRLRRFWSPEDSPATRLPSDEAYAEAFRERLGAAVQARLRTVFGAGVMLSGGLDSSSITCLARRQPPPGGLHALTLVFDDTPASDERRYAAEVTAPGGLEAHLVSGDGLSPLSMVDELVDRLGEPFFHTALALQVRLNEAARAAGARVLLDGNYGDSVVSYGNLRIAELVRAGRWVTAVRETAALTREMTPRWRIAPRLFWHFGLHPLTPEPVRRLRHAWRNRGRLDRPAWALGSFIHPDFARRMEAELGLSHRRHGPPPLMRTEADLLRFEVGRARTRPELYNQLAAAAGVEQSHPYLDRRVVEFCMGLPSEQRLSGGWTRIIVRRAMAGVLPEAIRWRRFKTIPSYSLGRVLLTRDLPALRERLGAANTLGEWVDLEAVERTYQGLARAAGAGDYERPEHRETMRALGRVLTLAVWQQRARL
jgi:asparagine synthase (glutamine-hydrolysing)